MSCPHHHVLYMPWLQQISTCVLIIRVVGPRPVRREHEDEPGPLPAVHGQAGLTLVLNVLLRKIFRLGIFASVKTVGLNGPKK
jgi:hypothetical protein